MGKVSFLWRRLKNLGYRNMLETARAIRRQSGKRTGVILLDMIACAWRYGAGYTDYAACSFWRLGRAERATHITRGVNNEYVRRLNDRGLWSVFDNKAEFLRRFAAFAGRDWVYLPETDASSFAAFLADRERIAVKPTDATCGRGFLLLEGEALRDPEALRERLLESGRTLAEEYIAQHPDMARLYPGSVNTLRLVTITVNGHPRIVYACMRVGNGARVDNFNAGGIVLELDTETGLVTKPGADKKGIVYERHPVTGARFLGFTPPFYREAAELVKKAALVEPGMGYVGWDVAVTERGPLLIEGNQFPGHDVYQIGAHLAGGLGRKPFFDAVLRGEDPLRGERQASEEKNCCKI